MSTKLPLPDDQIAPTGTANSSSTSSRQKLELSHVVVTITHEDGGDLESFVISHRGDDAAIDWEISMAVEDWDIGSPTLVLYFLLVRRYAKRDDPKKETLHHFALSITADNPAILGLDDGNLPPFNLRKINRRALLRPAVANDPPLLRFRDQGILFSGFLPIRSRDIEKAGFEPTQDICSFSGDQCTNVRRILAWISGRYQNDVAKVTIYGRDTPSSNALKMFNSNIESLADAVRGKSDREYSTSLLDHHDAFQIEELQKKTVVDFPPTKIFACLERHDPSKTIAHLYIFEKSPVDEHEFTQAFQEGVILNVDFGATDDHNVQIRLHSRVRRYSFLHPSTLVIVVDVCLDDNKLGIPKSILTRAEENFAHGLKTEWDGATVFPVNLYPVKRTQETLYSDLLTVQEFGFTHPKEVDEYLKSPRPDPPSIEDALRALYGRTSAARAVGAPEPADKVESNS